MYEIFRLLVKKILVPMLELIVKLMPRSLRVFLLAIIVDNLGLKNVRFDAPMRIGDPSKETSSWLNLGLFPGDRSVLPSILISGHWEASEPEFVAKHMKLGVTYSVFDVGANFGLFTLQLNELLRLNGNTHGIEEVIAFEPDPSIVPILRQNMKAIENNCISVKIIEKALGRQAGIATFYLDNANKANNSLEERAMNRAVAGVSKLDVEVIAASDIVSSIYANPKNRIVYKSDLQGIDPDIVSCIPLSFWNRVDVLVIELSAQVLKSYEFSTDTFRTIISTFDMIFIEESGSIKKITVDEISAVVSAAQDYRYFNLLCHRSSAMD